MVVLKGYKLSVVRGIGSVDLMYGMGTEVNDTVSDIWNLLTQ